MIKRKFNEPPQYVKECLIELVKSISLDTQDEKVDAEIRKAYEKITGYSGNVVLSVSDAEEIDKIFRYRKAHKDYIVCDKCKAIMKRIPEEELSFTPNVIYVCPDCGCRIRTIYKAQDSPVDYKNLE